MFALWHNGCWLHKVFMASKRLLFISVYVTWHGECKQQYGFDMSTELYKIK